MELLCGKCGNTLNVVQGQAGRTCRCPHCGHAIYVPAMDDSSPPPDEHHAGEPKGRPVGEPTSPDGGGEDDFLTKAKLLLQRKVLVVCGSCGERLTVEQRLGGKVLRCPACGGQIQIPLQVDDESFPQPDTHMEVLDVSEDEPSPPTETGMSLAVESDDNAGGGGMWATAIILIVMIALAATVIWHILRGRSVEQPPDEKPPISTAPAKPMPAPATQPVPKPTTNPTVIVATRPATPPPKPQAAVKILRVKSEVLTEDSAPAPPGKTLSSGSYTRRNSKSG